MGSKYTSQAASGYNASPPSDDGTASESNKVKWSTIKTKLSDVVKTLAEGINTAIVTALDHSARSVTASDTAAASDNERTIEVKTSSVNITLSDASTMAAGYIVSVANQSTGNITVSLATATNTIDMVTNATAVIAAKETQRYIVNAATNGYITEASGGRGLVLLGTGTASSSASISFTSGINSTFDNYVIYFSNVVPATNATNLLVTLSQDSGSTYLSASYHYASWAVNDGGSSGAGASASASNILVAGALSNSGGQGCSGWLSISNPSVSSTYKTVNWMLGYQASTGAVNTVSGSAQYQGDGNAINAIKFAMSSGNLATGNFQLYGLRKS